MFARTYTGAYMEDFTVLTTDGPKDIYECEACHALTTRPFDHEQWHEEEQ